MKQCITGRKNDMQEKMIGLAEKIEKEGQALAECLRAQTDGTREREVYAHVARIAALAEYMEKMLSGGSRKAVTGRSFPSPGRPGRKPAGKAPGNDAVNKTTIDKLRILLLDDDELTMSYHVSMFSRLGVPCDYVANGTDALDRIRQAQQSEKRYDACIVNWNMPGIGGMIRQIRESCGKEGIVIMGTTGEREQQETQMTASGVDYILGRPVYQAVLYRFLTEVCAEICREKEPADS